MACGSEEDCGVDAEGAEIAKRKADTISVMPEQKPSISRENGLDIQSVHCSNCGKLLLEAFGEVKKICPKCKTENHVVVTSKGIINLK